MKLFCFQTVKTGLNRFSAKRFAKVNDEQSTTYYKKQVKNGRFQSKKHIYRNRP